MSEVTGSDPKRATSHENIESFRSRHIGPSPADQQVMLESLGYASLDELTQAVVPSSIAATNSARFAKGKSLAPHNPSLWA